MTRAETIVGGAADGGAAAASAIRMPTGDAGEVVNRRGWALALALVVGLALAASLPGIQNGFAYDDLPIIRDNARVHTLQGLWRLFDQAYWPGFHSGDSQPAGLYRPLSVLAFALQWAAGGGAPWVFHAVNIALYAAIAAAVLWLASQVQRWRAAVLSAAVFAVHPVHVEAVGNAVGQSELLAALFCVLGVAVYVRARRRGRPSGRATALAAVLYAAACLSKEHGVLLLPLIVLAEWLAVLPGARQGRDGAAVRRLRVVAPLWGVLAAVAVAYLALRASVPDVVAGAQNTAILRNFPWTVRFYTFLNVVPEWFRLLMWPQRLAADYSPQEILVPLRWTWSMLSGIVVAVGVITLAWLTARRHRAASYAFAWTLTTLSIASGLFVATGVLLAERTLFLPSVGVALLAGAVADWALRAAGAHSRRLALAPAVAFLALVVAGAWRSAERQRVWRDNETLFASGVVDAPLSYRAHYSWGGQLFETGRYAEGEREVRIAIKLFPPDPDPIDYLGSRYMASGMCEHAIPLFHQALEINGGRRYTRLRLISCLLATGQADSAQRLAKESVAAVGADSLLTRMLFVADSVVAQRRRPAG